VSLSLREAGKEEGTALTEKEEKVTEKAQQPKDKNYNLISMLYHSSDVVETLKTYIQDAQEEGDQELIDFFSTALESNIEASQRAKELLTQRLEREQE
jgi:gas vesicle protein